MAVSVRVRAAAKVNLHLRVYGRRKDGYHDILSLFQAVSLADTIVIRSLKESDTIEIDGDFDCTAKATTIYQAVEAYRKRSGNRTGLSIAVDKQIPAGAGLGGGSSDAAATLIGLEELLGGGLGSTAIGRLGASIGSDVPFFLATTAAIVAGRGELVEPIAARDDFGLVIAFPGFAVSTVEAYGLLDLRRPDDSQEPDPAAEELKAAYRCGIREWPFANSFEPIIGESKPRILEAKAILLREGASFAAMSGSGSAVFGAFEDVARAEIARRALVSQGFEAFVTAPLARCTTLD